MKTLTKAEEEVMQGLWDRQKATVQELLDQIPEPRPAYNTISTILRILESKKLVSHEKEGRGYRYYPLISREDYRKFSLKRLLKGYFNGNPRELVSFFVKEESLSSKDLDEIMKLIDKD